MVELKSPPRWRAAPLVLALLCGLAAYCNSFHGPFVFDDIDAIFNNPRINRNLHVSGGAIATTLSGRPVLWVSFAIDEAIGGMNVEVYHATNLLIHLACGAVLFGIVCRNLLNRAFWGDRFEFSAPWLAGVVTAIWLVHPLNTQAVTYIVQRAESLAGLFYLVVIYALIRDADPWWGWKLAAIMACGFGMGTKESMAAAPIVALVYDRTFISGSFIAALKRRPLLYAGLAATWAILAALVFSGARGSSVGFGQNISALDYGRTQLGVIGHYLFLAVWPRNLALDYYDWPIAWNWMGVGMGGWIIAAGIVFFTVMFWFKPWLGFLGAWFFLILAPSSSVIPIFTEIAAEQRMYLPLVALIALVVVGGWVLIARSPASRWIAAMIAAGLVIILAGRTVARNAEYENPRVIWADNVALRPLNPRAHFNLGYTLMIQGKAAAAAGEFREALDLLPDYYAAARLLGHALEESGDGRAADAFYTQEIETFPAFSREAHVERGRLRVSRGDLAGAEADFQAATRPSGNSR